MAVPTYIMLTTLTPEGVQTIKNNPARIREVNSEIEQLGARSRRNGRRWVEYDFVNVVEAPDEKTIARVSLELGSRGTGRYETLIAIPIDDFIGSIWSARRADDACSCSAAARASMRSSRRSGPLAARAGVALRPRQRRDRGRRPGPQRRRPLTTSRRVVAAAGATAVDWWCRPGGAARRRRRRRAGERPAIPLLRPGRRRGAGWRARRRSARR